MLILLAAAALTATPPATSSAEDRSLIPAPPARCKRAVEKATADRTPRAGKLGDMPPGQQIKAVWRFDANGCPAPLVVKSEVGVNGR